MYIISDVGETTLRVFSPNGLIILEKSKELPVYGYDESNDVQLSEFKVDSAELTEFICSSNVNGFSNIMNSANPGTQLFILSAKDNSVLDEYYLTEDFYWRNSRCDLEMTVTELFSDLCTRVFGTMELYWRNEL